MLLFSFIARNKITQFLSNRSLVINGFINNQLFTPLELIIDPKLDHLLVYLVYESRKLNPSVDGL